MCEKTLQALATTSQLYCRERNGERIGLPRFFRRNLCSIMNLHSADSTGSGVNVGACVVRERGAA